MKRIYLGLVAVLIIVTGGVFLSAHLLNDGQIGPSAANPAYIVVNTGTDVTFTSSITDPKLKERTAILVRTDSSGTPVHILGRLKDDGRNGDVRRNDKTYTFRTTLNEAAVGPIQFRVAARFKNALRREDTGDDSDDDDWDRELASLNDPNANGSREHHRASLLRRLAGYTLSDAIQLDVFNLFTDHTLGVTFPYPPSWRVHFLPDVTYFTVPPDIEVLSISRVDAADNPRQFAEAAIADNNCPGWDVNGQPSDHIIASDAYSVLYVLACSATTEDYHYVFLDTNRRLVDITYHDDFDPNATEDTKVARLRDIIDSLR